MMGNTLPLFLLFQKLDYRDKDNSGFKKLAGIVIAYLFSNTMLSFSFSLVYDERSFVIMSLTSNLFLLTMIVINDFNNLFLATGSIDILRSLPIKIGQVFSAKFLSAVVYLLIFIIAASVPQIIFFYSISESTALSVSFFFTNILFCYLSIGSVTLIYCLILIYLKKYSTVFLNLFQFLFFIFVFYSTSKGSRPSSFDSQMFQKQDLLSDGFIKYLPQSFFSGSVYEPLIFLILLAACSVVFLMLYKFISTGYNILLENALSLKRNKSSKFKFPEFKKASELFTRLFPGSNIELASFRLIRDHINNSRYLRLKYIPLLIIPVIVVIIGFFSNSAEYLFFESKSGFLRTAFLVISPSVSLTVLLCARMLISNTKILDDSSSDTKWIFDSLPSGNISSYIKGVNSFIYFVMILPMLIFIFLMLLFKADTLTIFLNFIYISSSVYFVISIASLFDKTLPFTLESSKYNSATRFLEVLISMVIGVAVFLIQIFIFQNIIFVITATVLFITVSYLLNRN